MVLLNQECYRMGDLEDVKIRKATLDEIEKIEVLLQELIGDPLDDRKKYSREAFSSDDYAGIIAESAGEVVGFIDLLGFPDPGHGAKLGIILNFIVSESYRNMGIGDRLLDEAVKEAQKRNFREFHVWTEFENETAKAIYRKHGFVNESLVLEREFD
jgi:ribosomal protein S18 acetylase RimI-like enzyme